MNAEARKLKEYEKSKTFEEHSEVGTLGEQRTGSNQYLRNRLRQAFVAGMDAGKEIATQRISDVIRHEKL